MDRTRYFEQFYKENYKPFFFFALRYLDNEETCRDIVSNAFEYGWNHLDYDRVGEWRNLMLAYIHHKCIDELRHKSVKDDFAKARLASAERTEDKDLLEQQERVAIVKAHLQLLPPKTQLILRECMVNGKTYKEVAEELDITDSAVKKHIVKGLKFLVTIQQGEILLHYDMIAVKSHVEPKRWCFQTAEILEWPSALGEGRWYSISPKGL